MIGRVVDAIPVDADTATEQNPQQEQPIESTPNGEQSAVRETSVIDMVKQVIDSVKQRDAEQLAHILFYFFTALILGAVINGVILGFISSAIYRYFSKRNRSPLKRLHLLTKQRARMSQDHTQPDSDDDTSSSSPS